MRLQNTPDTDMRASGHPAAPRSTSAAPRTVSQTTPLIPGRLSGSRAAGLLPHLPWLALLAALAACAALYAGVAARALDFPFGLDYSEGIVWQQALWLGTPKLYGDIRHFPFLVCEYPPLYLVAERALRLTGMDMLAGGRLISILAAAAACALAGAIVHRFACLTCAPAASRPVPRTPNAALIAASIAALLPLTLLPIASWSILARVDCLALGLNTAGLLLGVISFRRPRAIYPAVLLFVAAVYTKQIYVAAAVALFPVSLARNRRHTLRAYVAGVALGLALLAALQAATGGRFIAHILLYTADNTDLAAALAQTGLWLTAYPIDAALVAAALILAWRRAGAPTLARLRAEEPIAWLAFLSLYLALTTLMLAAAGKTGAARNYFIEWMLLWCIWIGWLCAQAISTRAARPPGWVAAALLLLQLVPVFGGLRTMQTLSFSAQRRADWGALLARVRTIPGPLLSDDMVLVIRAGREVELEPGILLELARTGRWDENRLTRALQSHYFGAVITAYDPGDPTFDIRYLPRTRDTLLAAYPHVEKYGDYRLRLP